MIGKQLLEKKSVGLFKVHDLLNKRKQEGELTYEQNTTFEYSKKFVKLASAKAGKLNKALLEMDGMTEDAAIKIVDILPEDMETLKLCLSKEAKLKEDSLSQILELVKQSSAN